MIVSGLLTGILASRVVSGIVGEYLGWRFIFFVAVGNDGDMSHHYHACTTRYAM